MSEGGCWLPVETLTGAVGLSMWHGLPPARQPRHEQESQTKSAKASLAFANINNLGSDEGLPGFKGKGQT